MKPACEIGRVREDALHVRLHERGDVADGERRAREHGERDRPEVRLLRERGVQHAQDQDSAVAFVAADMKPVTGVGEPSYTSGVHWWNGAADAL